MTKESALNYGQIIIFIMVEYLDNFLQIFINVLPIYQKINKK